jgi:NAD(P)-dependent dehydrogenase (short-subunit alcohol dehydrogenase family)
MIDNRREKVTEAVQQIPVKRMATANEVAAAVAAVSRDDMSYYLGQVLVLNGGS